MLAFTDYIALYAAILSSVLFGWEIYKYLNRGAKLRIVVSKNKQLIPAPIEAGKLWISVTVTNVGDQPTTLTGLSFETSELQRKSKNDTTKKHYVVPNNPAGPQLPIILNPGELWNGFIAQETDEIDLDGLSENGQVWIGVSSSHKKKPMRKRLG